MTSLEIAEQRLPQLPTTVLVVDDDEAVLRRVSREALLRTNLGVLVADSMGQAVDILRSGVALGAILVDLNFRPDTRDPARNLNNGLDLLALVAEERAELSRYVLSVDATDRAFARRASDRNIVVRRWFNKLAADTSQLNPWDGIERDMIRDALFAEPSFREATGVGNSSPDDIQSMDAIVDRVRCLSYPRVTYIQSFETRPNMTVIKPIEVLVRRMGDSYGARAVDIPLLIEGFGDDPVEALEDLSDSLVEEIDSLMGTGDRATGYARYLVSILKEHVKVAELEGGVSDENP